MTKRMSGLSTLLALTAVAVAPAGASAKRQAEAHALRPCANADLVVTDSNRSAAEAAEVCLINEQRTSRGLRPLRVSDRLDRSAQSWSDTLVAEDEFTHGTNFAGRIAATGFRWSAAGENIAAGFTTPFAVVRAWMGDVGHCQNILRPMFDYVGTGLDAASGGTMADTWTQDFARLAGTHVGEDNMRAADGCPYQISDASTPQPTLVRAAGSAAGDSPPTARPTAAASDNGPTISW